MVKMAPDENGTPGGNKILSSWGYVDGVYRPLYTSDSFRILELEPGVEDDAIRCVLHVRTLMDDAPYEVLSYTWESDIDSDYTSASFENSAPAVYKISIEDITREFHRRVEVRPNLWKFLKVIREADFSRYIWVDALCINQESLLEKEAQVQMIGKIFARAETVLVWLGDATAEDEALFEMLRSIPRADEYQYRTVEAHYSHLLRVWYGFQGPIKVSNGNYLNMIADMARLGTIQRDRLSQTSGYSEQSSLNLDWPTNRSMGDKAVFDIIFKNPDVRLNECSELFKSNFLTRNSDMKERTAMSGMINDIIHFTNSYDVISAQDLLRFLPSFTRLVKRRYWTRTWVVQEYLFAQKLKIYSGSVVLEEQVFKTGVYKLIRNLLIRDLYNSPISIPENWLESHAGPMWNLIELRSTSTASRSQQRFTYDQIISFHETLCGDPRDKLYAFQGLLSKHDPWASIAVDYESSVSIVLWRALIAAGGLLTKHRTELLVHHFQLTIDHWISESRVTDGEERRRNAASYGETSMRLFKPGLPTRSVIRFAMDNTKRRVHIQNRTGAIEYDSVAYRKSYSDISDRDPLPGIKTYLLPDLTEDHDEALLRDPAHLPNRIHVVIQDKDAYGKYPVLCIFHPSRKPGSQEHVAWVLPRWLLRRAQVSDTDRSIISVDQRLWAELLALHRYATRETQVFENPQPEFLV